MGIKISDINNYVSKDLLDLYYKLFFFEHEQKKYLSSRVVSFTGFLFALFAGLSVCVEKVFYFQRTFSYIGFISFFIISVIVIVAVIYDLYLLLANGGHKYGHFNDTSEIADYYTSLKKYYTNKAGYFDNPIKEIDDDLLNYIMNTLSGAASTCTRSNHKKTKQVLRVQRHLCFSGVTVLIAVSFSFFINICV